MDKEHNCPHCEYHKQRAARWRAETYKLAGYDGIELPWVGLTHQEVAELLERGDVAESNEKVGWYVLPYSFAQAIEAKLKEKNT